MPLNYASTDDWELTPGHSFPDDRKARHDEAVEQYIWALDVIREQIQAYRDTQDANALYTVRETWEGIPPLAKCHLWLSVRAGGWFTTVERKVLRELPKD